MKFFRKDRLFLPEADQTPKGRSMVGYSRRSFFGFLGAGAAVAASGSLLAEPCEPADVADVWTTIGELPMPTPDRFHSIDSIEWITFKPHWSPSIPFEAGQILDINFGGSVNREYIISGVLTDYENSQLTVDLQNYQSHAG